MFWWLTQHILTATILAGIVALVCRWGRVGPALKHGLWLLVLIKLLVPPFVQWPWALPVAGPLHETLVRSTDSANPQGELFLAVVTESIQSGNRSNSGSVDHAVGSELSLLARVTSWQPPAWFTPALLALWLAGSLAMALVQTIRMVRFRRLLKGGRTAPRPLVRQVGALATKLSVRPPGTLVLRGIGSPFVWGLHRAQLLWPAALLGRLADASWRTVIAHELAHLRRRDHWVAFVQMLAECVWWWNPLFWYVRRQIRLNAELACDAWVVSALPQDRRAYAEALIEVTEHLSQTTLLTPALGINSGARQALERRLTMIMRDRVPCKVPVVGIVVMGVLGLAALPSWAQFQTSPPPAQNAPKVTSGLMDVVVELSDAELQVDKVLTVTVDDEQDDAPRAGSAANRERKLRELESKIQSLRKELELLRASGGDGQRKRVLLREAKPEMEVQVVKPGTFLNKVQSYEVDFVEPDGKIVRKVQPPEGKSYRIQVTPSEKGHVLRNEVLIETAPEKVIVGHALVDPVMELKGKLPPKKTYQLNVAPGDLKVQALNPREAGGVQYRVVSPIEGERAVMLSRVSYKLSHAKAEALSSFLNDNVKAPILETNVDGDSLIVTTTPEVQRTIGAFVALLHSKAGASKDGKRTGHVDLSPEDGGAKADVLRLWTDLVGQTQKSIPKDILYKITTEPKDQPRQ